MKRILCAVALLAAVVLAGCGPKGYNLSGGPRLKKGQVVREEQTLELKDAVFTVPVGKKTLTQKATFGTKKVTETEALSANKSRITYVLDFQETTVTLFGKEKRIPRTGPLQGKSILVTRKEGKVMCLLESDSQTDEQKHKAAELAKNLAADDALFPNRKLKLGDIWEPTVSLAKWLGTSSADPDGKMRMEFKEIVERDSGKCARIALTVEATATITDKNGKPVKVEVTASGAMVRDLRTNVDLSSELKGTMTMIQPQKTPDGRQASIKGPFTITTRATVR